MSQNQDLDEILSLFNDSDLNLPVASPTMFEMNDLITFADKNKRKDKKKLSRSMDIATKHDLI